jgi:hypothetical protein
MEHFLGPWSFIGVGFDGDGGWAALQAYLDVGIEGHGEPYDAWTNTGPIRARTAHWASHHESVIRTSLDSPFTWITSTTVHDPQGDEYSEFHRHTGNWTEWLASLTKAGRWLDLSSLQCALEAHDASALVIEASDGEISCHHFGETRRADGRTVYLALHNLQWYFIRPRTNHQYPTWWHELPNVLPDDLFVGR